MPVSWKHVSEQGPVLKALAAAAISAARGPSGEAAMTTPGPWFEAELPARPQSLLNDYVRFCGGDPAWYRGQVVPHLFPQWGFPLAAKALAGVPYPMAKVMNAGCRLEIRAPLPANEPLMVRARLESIDDDGSRAILTQRIVTGTRSSPDAVWADLKAFVPLAKKTPGGSGKAKATVPADARELAYLKFPLNAGLDFAKLTGDFNPIHWLAPYAKAFGFRSVILHGFGTLGRAIETMNRVVFSGDVSRLKEIDARFTRPLTLPAKAGVYLSNHSLFVGDAPAGGAYLEARLTLEKPQ